MGDLRHHDEKSCRVRRTTQASGRRFRRCQNWHWHSTGGRRRLVVRVAQLNSQVLIDAIVQQTMVFIAQLATAGGVRAPLAKVAGQVFLELTSELQSQGVKKKVIADMFGMALRTYHRRTRELKQSQTDAGRTLWDATLAFLSPLESEALGTLSRHRTELEELRRRVDLHNAGLPPHQPFRRVVHYMGQYVKDDGDSRDATEGTD
jgi:hypothetical protein